MYSGLKTLQSPTYLTIFKYYNNLSRTIICANASLTRAPHIKFPLKIRLINRRTFYGFTRPK